jgi:hypothetical protein
MHPLPHVTAAASIKPHCMLKHLGRRRWLSGGAPSLALPCSTLPGTRCHLHLLPLLPLACAVIPPRAARSYGAPPPPLEHLDAGSARTSEGDTSGHKPPRTTRVGADLQGRRGGGGGRPRVPWQATPPPCLMSPSRKILVLCPCRVSSARERCCRERGQGGGPSRWSGCVRAWTVEVEMR